MRHPEIGSYLAQDGRRLLYRHWSPTNNPPVCRIVALHGIQSHSGWYGYSSDLWCRAGCELFFLDRRGSGMNEGGRGHVDDEHLLIDDVVRFVRQVREETPQGIPVVLLAVSWGGKLAVHVAAQSAGQIDGLALLYPGLRARVQATWWQNVQLLLAGVLGLHQKRVPIPLEDPALFTGNRDWQEYIRHDPLTLRELSVGFLLANRQLDRRLGECPAQIYCPTLLLLAGGDQIIDNLATRRFVAGFASTSLTMRTYPNACHTLEFEPDRELFAGDVLRWLQGLASAERTS